MKPSSALRPILLLSDIGPCSNYTGGVVLAQQCRLLPPGELVAFIVQNRWLKPEPYADLAHLPTATVRKPDELYEPTQWKRGPVAAKLTEYYRSTVVRDRLVAQAVAYGRKHRVRGVWAVLEGQTVVRMAARVAKRLKVPLYSQVWDPISWWLQAHYVDRWNSDRTEADFRHALQISRSTAAPSWAMAEHLRQTYGVQSLPLIASYDRSQAHPPSLAPKNPGELVIAIVGQLYAADAWRQFLAMLRAAEWRVAGRNVRILYFGRTAPAGVPADRLKDAGWAGTGEIIQALAREADICYCPYPFTPDLEETARLSFPSKAVMYMAAGKPVFFHGPHYSSPAKYFAGNHAAAVCASMDPYVIHGMFRWLVNDTDEYAATAAKAHAAFLNDFTLDRLQAAFDEFLDRTS